MRSVATECKVDPSTVWFWVHRAAGSRLDRVDFSARKPGRAWNRTAGAVEWCIAELRKTLRESVLGEYGAPAIQAALREQTPDLPPSIPAINRVLARLGLRDAARRVRRPAPPKGWYLPAVVSQRAELDCFDFIEDLKIADGPLVDVLTAKSLHGTLSDAWAMESMSAKAAVPCLQGRWQRDGAPAYAQFDNHTVFQGAHQFAHTVGRISRLCLQLKVTPVFVPPLEHGMQNSIEGFNALWQAKVWQRHRVGSLRELQARSDQYIAAHRARIQALAEAAPQRRPISRNFEFDPRAPLQGQIIFIRRTDEAGRAHLLGQHFSINRNWLHRLVRCEVDFDHHCIRCFALRRRAPKDQPLLATIPYRSPNQTFKGDL